MNSQQEKDIGHFINYVRIATAIAIIKSKPPDVSTLEHAQLLCGRYANNQLQWKDKALQLENEVLLLRQKLLQSEINTNACTDYDEESQYFYPTPPSSSDTGNLCATRDEGRLTQHAMFLKSIISLNTVPNHCENIILSDPLGLKTSIETMKKSVETIQHWLCNKELHKKLTSKVVEHSARIVVQLVEKSGHIEDFYTEVCNVVMSFAESVIVSLLQHSHLNDKEYQSHLEAILLEFTKSSNIRSKVTAMLVKCIQEYSEVLRKVKKGQLHMESYKFENICTLFQCLEKFIVIETKEKHCEHYFNQSVCNVMTLQLEKSLLHISETFPLFAHYVWHIGGLLEELKTKQKWKK